MNRYVEYYIENRKKDPNPLNRQLIFAAGIQTIVSAGGSMEDVKALTAYYQKETEELKNEKHQTA